MAEPLGGHPRNPDLPDSLDLEPLDFDTIAAGSLERRLASMDTLICQPKRLAILAALDERGSSSFRELHDLTGITTGNLSSHVRRLEDCALVSVKKEFVYRKPRTTITLESAGRQAITNYLEEISSILDQWRSRRHVLLSVSRRP